MKLKDEAIARQLENLITKALIARFKSQGHNLTGKGINSLETKVNESMGGVIIQILGLEYMGFQDTGRKAGKGMPIDILEAWVKRRGIASEAKEVKRIAFLINRNMKRIGMHSNRGKIDMSKRHFISKTIENGSNVIQSHLFKMFEKNFDLVVTNLTTQMTKTIINL